MAQKMQVVVVDDLTGEPLPDGQAQTVSFALDGTSYEIDLSRDNADALRQAVNRYVGAARKVGRTAKFARRGGRSGRDTAAIRAWARENGLAVSERGRVPGSVIEAYEAAN
ncbi:Lsr2 family protein [Geodermatophilus sp. DSM 44513]|uniref:histone-like nucleoid-structuring protein Lsr2 n=1 Tax=Geodermatophilus sp. DSM 44513 TaxID=1528104 RepID=UPI00126E1FEB|nr:Lsr2 family protein [Geodermatophilus sp. DSM 44513]WNV75189.1 Lsr2 family protein [Geodermatophilus sp. DSM 44513]